MIENPSATYLQVSTSRKAASQTLHFVAHLATMGYWSNTGDTRWESDMEIWGIAWPIYE